jgi:PAS domain S-box-containing protein
MPVVLFLITTALTLLLWRVMARSEERAIAVETQVTAEHVKRRLEAWFDARAAVLTLFAEAGPLGPGFLEDEFTARAQRVIQLYPGFQALNFIDEHWVIRQVVPLEANRAALGKDLHNHPSATVREALAYALEKRAVHRTPLIQLLQGEPGFALYAPIFLPDGSNAGFINGVFGVDELVDSCLDEVELRENFHLRLITPDQETAYRNYQEGYSGKRGTVVTLPVRIVDRDWQLEIAMSPEGIAWVSTNADEYLVAIGFALSLLLAFLLRAYQVRQAELAEGREGYRLLVENQADFLVKTDPEGLVVFASPSFCRFLGCQEADLLDRPFLDRVHPEDLQTARDALTDIMISPHRVESEFRTQTARGERWTGWVGSSYQGSRGEFDGFVWVGRNVTRRRELEAQLRQSQRLQAVGQLAGGIAHDFNNILQAIQGYLELVMDGQPRDSETFEDLHQARLATDRAAVLVRQLLAFSRRQILKPVNLDLNQVVAGMRSMLGRVIGSSIPIQFEPQEDLGLVLADQGQLEQIIMNLAVNARDAMESGGQITIATSNQYLDEDFCRRHQGKTAGHYVRLDFSDTGVGMSREVLDKLFEPFFTTKESGSGTGLGLATVYGIVKQHEGMILVDSQEGQGSRFSIYLPTSEGAIEAEPAVLDSTASLGKETILFAEDEPMLRKLGTRILQSAGYQVLVATDGREAWQLYNDYQSHIDLAVLDVVMPNLDGRALAERIRARQPGLPVIFVSGYDSDTASGRKDPLPGSVRVAKPYNRNDLLTAIRKILDSQGGQDDV